MTRSIRLSIFTVAVAAMATAAEGADTAARRLNGQGALSITREHRKTRDEIDAAPAARTSAPQAAARSWSVDATVGADRRLVGSVTTTIGGMPLTGRLQGQVEGRRVWGDVLDAAGKQVATFEGVADEDGALRGTFTSSNDDRGEWSWSGALPR